MTMNPASPAHCYKHVLACTLIMLGTGSSFANATQNDQSQIRPITIEQHESLSFGQVIAGSNTLGTVTIDPANGRKTVTHGVMDMGGFHSPALFLISGQPNARFTIGAYRQKVFEAIEGRSGSGKVEFKKITSYPDKFGQFDKFGQAWVTVGAEVKLKLGHNYGEHIGHIMLEVKYLNQEKG